LRRWWCGGGPGYWEQRLKEAGPAARRDEEWRNFRRVFLEAMRFHGLALAYYDRYTWEQEEDPLEAFKAAVPPEIRRIAELDHRRRTQREKERLAAWLAEEGRRLRRWFGFM